MKSSCDLVDLHRRSLASCKMQAVSMQDGNASGLLCKAGGTEALSLLSPGQQPPQLRIAHGHRGPALQQERQIPFHVEIVRPGHLHHRVSPRAGLRAGRRIAEQPVPAPHAERGGWRFPQRCWTSCSVRLPDRFPDTACGFLRMYKPCRVCSLGPHPASSPAISKMPAKRAAPFSGGTHAAVPLCRRCKNRYPSPICTRFEHHLAAYTTPRVQYDRRRWCTGSARMVHPFR